MDEISTQKKFHIRADEKRYRTRLGNPVIRKKESRLAQRILESLPSDNHRILEVGCGEGSNLHFLKAERPNLFGVGLDFSIEKISYALNNQCDHGVVADATALPFSDQAFDLVLMRDLLHHVNWARETVLFEALRVTRKKGVVIVCESSPWSPLNWVFMALFPTERGMIDSTTSKLLRLTRPLADISFEPVEASFLCRAIAYFAGAPQNWRAHLLRPLFGLARAWERLMEVCLPSRYWTYRMLRLHKRD